MPFHIHNDTLWVACPCGWGWTGNTMKGKEMVTRLHKKKCEDFREICGNRTSNQLMGRGVYIGDGGQSGGMVRMSPTMTNMSPLEGLELQEERVDPPPHKKKKKKKKKKKNN